MSLASHLVAEPQIGRALAAYDEERRKPTQRLARVATVVSRMARVRRFTKVRDAALRVALLAGPPD